MKGLGAKAYRCSIAWPRLLPDGKGALNDKGLAFYDRLVDELLRAGIEPFATLYHWDLPQALQDKGGWQARDTALAFGDYAGLVARKLSDRVGHIFTLYDMQDFVEHGHRRGTRVGPAENIIAALPAVETPENIRAAELATREMNAPYLTVMLEGRYTDAYLAEAGANAPKFTPRDLEIIASPVDFVGLNVYSPGLHVLASEAARGYAAVKIPSSYPR